MSVAAVIPAFNEENHIKAVVNGLKAVSALTRIYVVDDGSIDATASLAESAGAIVIRHEVNSGVGAALRDGILRAEKEGADIIVVMGGDDQDDPSQIPKLLTPIVDGGYDLVQGSRWIKGGEVVNIPFFRRITTKLYAFILRICTGFPFTDGTNGFRAFKVSVLERVDLNQQWLNHYELEPYLLYKAVQLGFKVTEAPVTKRYLVSKGYTKMVPVLDWWRILSPVIFLRLGIKK